jgi:hypothetical protein
MPDKISCEIFIACNEDDDWIVTHDESEALEKLAENAGGYQARVVKLTVKMTPPVMTETAVDIPDEAGSTQAIEAQAAE